MADPKDTYDVEPEKPGVTPPPISPAPPGKPLLDKPGLLEGFEEDADFDKDPELERVITGKGRDPVGIPAPKEDSPEFGQPLFGQAVHWALAGAVMLLAAMVVTGINYDTKRFLRIALTLYTAFLHTGTGVVAAYVAAILTNTRIKNLELTAARMFAAVAAFLLIFRLNINFFGPDYANWRIEELVLATLAYLGIVAASFKLLQRNPLVFLVGAHFILWMVVQVGMELARSVGDAPARQTVRATAPPPPAAPKTVP
jgi:hypothetical protein